MCEQILKNLATARNFRVALLRYFNACGADPDGQLGERHDPETHLIPLAIDAASGRGLLLQIFGADYPTADGTCERDFIHVSDLARAHVAALNRPNNGSEALALNLGAGRSYSILEIVSAIERVTGHPVPVIEVPDGLETQQPLLPTPHERSAYFISRQNILTWKPSLRRRGDRARSGACSAPADCDPRGRRRDNARGDGGKASCGGDRTRRLPTQASPNRPCLRA